MRPPMLRFCDSIARTPPEEQSPAADTADHDGGHVGGVALHREDLRARPAAVARLGDLDACLLQPLVAPRDVGRAPRQAPELVGPSDTPFFRSCAISTTRSPQRKNSSRAPQSGIAAVEPQVEAEPPGIERDRALGIGRADHDVVERGDRRRLAALQQRRGLALPLCARPARSERRASPSSTTQVDRRRARSAPRAARAAAAPCRATPSRTPSTKAAPSRRDPRSRGRHCRPAAGHLRPVRPSSVSYAPTAPSRNEARNDEMVERVDH